MDWPRVMRLTDRVLDLFFPSHCTGCLERVDPGADWCAACAATFVDGATAACPRCGLIWLDPPPGGGKHLCGTCIRNPPDFRWAQAAFAYGGVLQDAIRRWKNGPDEGLGRPLARLMMGALARDGGVARLAGSGPSGEVVVSDAGLRSAIVVPIPSRRDSLMVRAFNPAGALGLTLARALRLPYGASALTLVGKVRGSRGLGRRERASRMVGVMTANERIVRDRLVIVVDDVVTTGATIAEATRACLAAGANGVVVFALARVPAS